MTAIPAIEELHRPKTSDATRVLIASWIGTVIEWYDFFAYGTAAALVFGKLFFPNSDPLVGTLIAFASYAVGFVARPIGGIVCGHFGDRIGRKSMLVLTLLLMGIATTLIGCLPTYAAIGVWAPVSLVTLRLVQGFAIGGEYGGAALLAVEFAPDGRRGLFGSLPQTGAPAGLLLASGAFALASTLPESDLLSWGWRLPFLASAVLVVFGTIIRARIVDSPAFAEVKAQRIEERSRAIVAVLTQRRNMLILAGCRIAEATWFYLMASFIIAYGATQLGIPKSTMLTATMAGAGLELITIPLIGLISDRIGRRPVFIAGASMMALMAYPFFWALETKDPAWVFIAVIAALNLGHAVMYGVESAFFSEMFPTRLRYSGLSIAMQGATIIGGGLAPLIATALIGWSGGASWPVSVYCLALALIAVASASVARETHREPLSHK